VKRQIRVIADNISNIMKKNFITLLLIGTIFSSCETLQQIATQVGGTQLGTVAGSTTTYSNATGLKEALSVGIANAVTSLNQENGYYSNAALKILLPEEASTIVDNIKLVPGGQKMVNDVVLRLNRAAEDAASEAKPIFVSAIKNISFTDATGILFGKDTAATNYLRKTTYGQLMTAFQPKVEASLGKDLVGTMSTTESWTTLTSAYNKVANSLVGKAASLKPVNTNLSAYVTQQALNGLFLKVGAEEKSIRENPSARVTTVLQKVFGQLDPK